MDHLRKQLRLDIGENILAKEFLNEAVFWLEHIDWLTRAYDSELGLAPRMFLLNDITYNYMAMLNWVALISSRKNHISNKALAEFVKQKFKWPDYVAEALITCVRNPTMHAGRSYIWGVDPKAHWSLSVKKFGEGVQFTAAFDPNVSYLGIQPAPWGPRHPSFIKSATEDGFINSGLIKREGVSDEVVTTFFFMGFRVKIEKLFDCVFNEMKAMDYGDEEKFRELNLKATLTRVPAPENGGYGSIVRA